MFLLPENDPFLNIAVGDLDLNNLPSNFHETVNEMIDLMYKVNAIGLAAPQVGLSWRMFVMHTTNGPKVCINPEIYKVGDMKPTKEGCLSFPSLRLIIHRPNFIQAGYYDLLGDHRKEYFDGIEAVCFQHELDHLDGITFDQRVSKFQYKNALKKRKTRKAID